MTAAELGTERTRLDGELNRADSHYTPVEKKKMRNLLRRIETELSKKSLEPAIMTTPAAAAGVEGAPVNGGAAVAPAAAGAAPAKAEKPREKTTSEKIRDKIHSRRFGTPKNASESSGDQPSPTYGKKNN